MRHYARLALGSVSALDSWQVTVGGTGTQVNQDRTRGFSSGAAYGSITPSTSALYGLTVQAINYDENLGVSSFYQLQINGAANSGWTTLTIGTKTLARAAATSFAAGLWKWTTADGPAVAFGTLASVKAVTLS